MVPLIPQGTLQWPLIRPFMDTLVHQWAAAAMQGSARPIGSNIGLSAQDTSGWTIGSRFRSAKPLVIRQPALLTLLPQSYRHEIAEAQHRVQQVSPPSPRVGSTSKRDDTSGRGETPAPVPLLASISTPFVLPWLSAPRPPPPRNRASRSLPH